MEIADDVSLFVEFVDVAGLERVWAVRWFETLIR